MIEMAQWCNLCNAHPSDGLLTVENPFEPNGEPVKLEACQSCVEDLPWKDGMVVSEIQGPDILGGG